MSNSDILAEIMSTFRMMSNRMSTRNIASTSKCQLIYTNVEYHWAAQIFFITLTSSGKFCG
jgi:hypothetical protein